jgi:hypothetical protein
MKIVDKALSGEAPLADLDIDDTLSAALDKRQIQWFKDNITFKIKVIGELARFFEPLDLSFIQSSAQCVVNIEQKPEISLSVCKNTASIVRTSTICKSMVRNAQGRA